MNLTASAAVKVLESAFCNLLRESPRGFEASVKRLVDAVGRTLCPLDEELGLPLDDQRRLSLGRSATAHQRR